jgi:hypothetical protein
MRRGVSLWGPSYPPVDHSSTRGSLEAARANEGGAYARLRFYSLFRLTRSREDDDPQRPAVRAADSALAHRCFVRLATSAIGKQVRCSRASGEGHGDFRGSDTLAVTPAAGTPHQCRIRSRHSISCDAGEGMRARPRRSRGRTSRLRGRCRAVSQPLSACRHRASPGAARVGNLRGLAYDRGPMQPVAPLDA